MRQLTNKHLEEAMAYAMKEPEFNLFLIGDMEIYGLEGEHVSAFTADEWVDGPFPYFILDYRGNFLVYSQDENYDKQTAARFLRSRTPKNISGKRCLVEPLIAFLPDLEIVPEYLARLDQVNPSAVKASLGFPVTRLGEKDVAAIYGLLSQIEEFYTIRDKGKDTAYADILESITRGGRMYGIYDREILVAAAGTTAENSMAAMLVSVATHPDFRRQGYASAIAARLCRDCLEEGMKFLCLFYNNPDAGKIYHYLGFNQVGEYAMVRSKAASLSENN